MIKKPHLVTSISFHKKVLSTLSIYKIVIRLKSQVLSKEDCRLVADRHTCNQILLLDLKALGALDILAHHLSYQGNPKSPPHIFFVLHNLVCLTWGRLCLNKVLLSKGSDVSYIGHRPRAIYLCDRKTGRLTDGQADRQVYFALLELADLISLSVDGLSPNCQ